MKKVGILLILLLIAFGCNVTQNLNPQENLQGTWYTVSEGDDTLYLEEWVFAEDGALAITQLNNNIGTESKTYWIDDERNLWVEDQAGEEMLGRIRFIADRTVAFQQNGEIVLTLIQREE